jgi:acyl-CoA thioester hydrolase
MSEETVAALPGKHVEVPVIIRFGDTDPYGVVYFASYFRYCHHGIEEFLRSVGLPPHTLLRNEEEGFGLPIVGAACDFLRPVKYGEQLRLRVYIVRAGNRSLTFGFHFLRADKEEIVARGQASMVAIDKTWQSRALPGRLRDAVEPFVAPVTHG